MSPTRSEWSKDVSGERFLYAAAIEVPFRGDVHVHHQETVLPIKDEAPKFRDIPKEMGGSGVNVPE